MLVLDLDCTGPDEIVRVFLQDGQVYRAELSSPNVALQIKGIVRTIQTPYVSTNGLLEVAGLPERYSRSMSSSFSQRLHP